MHGDSRLREGEDAAEAAMRARLVFSVIPYYLFVASGQEIFPAQLPARSILFSLGARERYVLSRDRKNERARATEPDAVRIRGI